MPLFEGDKDVGIRRKD